MKYMLILLWFIVGAAYGLKGNETVSTAIIIILSHHWIEEQDRQISKLKSDIIRLYELRLKKAESVIKKYYNL